MDPSVIMFAISAGAKLGRKAYQVLLDETHERPMLLPVGDLFGSIQEARALDFFGREENLHLISEGGPYHGASGPEVVLAYKTIMALGAELGAAGSLDAVEVVGQLHKFRQYQAGFGAQPPAKRLLGTIVEIGIDYFIANPDALLGGKQSRGEQLVHAFVSGLDGVDFAEGQMADIAAGVFRSGLTVLGDKSCLISSDKRIQVLLGGVSKALLDDFQRLATSGASLAEKDSRRDFLRQVADSILTGSAGAIADNPELFIRGDAASERVIRDTVSQFLRGVEGYNDLLSPDSMERLVRSALNAVAGNPGIVTGNAGLQAVLSESLKAMTGKPGDKLFTSGSVSLILRTALDSVSRHADLVVAPDTPREELMVSTIKALAAGLSADLGTAQFRTLFTTDQLVRLADVVFVEVAKCPEKLIGGDTTDAKRTALAQVLGSVATALAEDPRQMVTGDGALELVRVALGTAANNADKLLDLRDDTPTTNLLYAVLREFVAGVAASRGKDGRELLSRAVVADAGIRLLGVASDNAGAIGAGKAVAVSAALGAVVALANAELSGQVNGQNLPTVYAAVLRGVLQGALDLTDEERVKIVVSQALAA